MCGKFFCYLFVFQFQLSRVALNLTFVPHRGDPGISLEQFETAKNTGQRVVVGRRDRIEFMIVTASTRQGSA